MTELFLKILFLIVCCPDKYFLATLKLIPDWFVTRKMIKKLYTDLYPDESILYFNEDSGNVAFSCNEMGILNIGRNNINLDNNFDEVDFDRIINIRLLAWHIKFEKFKPFPIAIQKLMSVAWHPKR